MTPDSACDPSTPFALTKPAALLRIAGNDTRLFLELADIICRAIPDYLESLERALVNNDPAATRAALHKIKGSLQMLGAEATLQHVNDLGAYIRANEALPPANDTQQLIDQMIAIRAEVGRYPQDGAPLVTP